MEKTFGEKVMTFYDNLCPPQDLSSGIDWILNIRHSDTRQAMVSFYKKYYGDSQQRVFWFGINPGRWGSGLTGIGFTDPINLETACCIPNPFPKKHELSSLFIYTMLEEYGSISKFYSRHYFTAVCPLGLLKDKKNYNYYDDQKTLKEVEGFLISSMDSQVSKGAYPSLAVCIGQGKNFKILKEWNNSHHWFDNIITLPHPRWIMQYKRKELSKYIDMYLQTIDELP